MDENKDTGVTSSSFDPLLLVCTYFGHEGYEWDTSGCLPHAPCTLYSIAVTINSTCSGTGHLSHLQISLTGTTIRMLLYDSNLQPSLPKPDPVLRH